MSIKATEIVGLGELMKAFAAIGDEAMTHLKPASDEAGAVVLAKAQSKVSECTGKLKSKLKLTKSRVKKGAYSISSKVGFSKGAMYGVPLELGHRLVIHGNVVGTVKEKPYLRPAADESKEQVVDIITGAMNKALDKMGGLK